MLRITFLRRSVGFSEHKFFASVGRVLSFFDVGCAAAGIPDAEPSLRGRAALARHSSFAPVLGPRALGPPGSA